MTSETSELKSCVTSTKKQPNFLSALKDSEFRMLLNDYMHDITDVHHHNETVHCLSQRQNEHQVVKNKHFVQLKPGFVVKTTDDKKQKVFINVCSSDKMQPPLNTNVTSNQPSLSWYLPYSIGIKRLEMDKGGVNVPTFDVCFHPQVIEFAMARVDFKHLVITTCLNAVEDAIRDSRCKPRALLARKYHILKGIDYKSGDPVPMCLRRKDWKVTEMSNSKTVKEVQVKNETIVDLSLDNSTMLDDKETITAAIDQVDDLKLTQVEEIDNSIPWIKKVSRNNFDSKQKLEKLQQKKKLEHQLVYCGRFEHFYDVQADPDKQISEDGNRPKELVVEVNFPLSTSAKGIDLDVSERMLRLSTDVDVVGDYEPLELVLPFPVVQDKGCAKFDRKKRKLVVTLPVHPPPKPKPHSVLLIVRDDDEKEEKGNELPQSKVVTLTSSKVFAPKQKNEGQNNSLVRRDTTLIVASDSQAMAQNQRKTQRHPLTAVTRSSQAVMAELAAIKDDVSDNLPPLKSCGGEEIDTAELCAEETDFSLGMSASIESASTTVVDPIKPPFETHITLKCLSYIVSVAGIDSTSVKLTLPSNCSLRLQFLDSDKQVYELHVAILPVDIDPSTAEFDVASENMVVILHKKYAAIASAA
ncbi:unnamed protein product [Peronospora farinosa]|uniref:PIH1 domain-containing protein 1 n=1 Tax=Peronospora farinosa TaxID=134698 RepID=A0AAV0TT21_9STRA|nr:unnamed protein product [Peronospora farinosa]